MKTLEKAKKLKNYDEIPIDNTPGIKTGMPLLDDFLSKEGGLPKGSLIFLTGTSGSGKSTLSKLIQKGVSKYKSMLYERETSASALAKQLKSIKISHKNAFVSDENEGKMKFMDVMKEVNRNNIKLLIIDSLQAAAVDFKVDGKGETEAQMELFNILKKWKEKTNNIAILIGQLTKANDYKGASDLKFLSDIHLHATYDKKKNLRYLEASKSRNGGAVNERLYYRFVKDERVIEFYDENDRILEEIISFLEEIEEVSKDSSNNKFSLFTDECSSFIDKVNAKQIPENVKVNKIMYGIKELADKYKIKIKKDSVLNC
jgi:predicted ATP-dependent serine protease